MRSWNTIPPLGPREARRAPSYTPLLTAVDVASAGVAATNVYAGGWTGAPSFGFGFR